MKREVNLLKKKGQTIPAIFVAHSNALEVSSFQMPKWINRSVNSPFESICKSDPYDDACKSNLHNMVGWSPSTGMVMMMMMMMMMMIIMVWLGIPNTCGMFDLWNLIGVPGIWIPGTTNRSIKWSDSVVDDMLGGIKSPKECTWIWLVLKSIIQYVAFSSATCWLGIAMTISGTPFSSAILEIGMNSSILYPGSEKT